MKFKTVLGKDLKVGDTIRVWWNPDNVEDPVDTIIKLRKYPSLLSDFLLISRAASFEKNKTGMTIEYGITYYVEDK